MRDSVRSFVGFFSSLKLTVVLLALSMFLVFFATLDQVNLGIWAVQQKYFRSLFVMWFIPNTNVPLPVYPGGYLIGAFLFLNLGAAYVTRFRLNLKKGGLFLSHTGLVILLLGELFTGILQEDYQMNLVEGQTSNYAESFRDIELAVIDTTNPGYDEVVAIPSGVLEKGAEIQHPRLPFRVIPKAYYRNATPAMRTADSGGPEIAATQGIGLQVTVRPARISYRDEVPNTPGGFIEIAEANKSLGTWVVSTQLGAPQTFAYEGKTWKLVLRPARRYLDFSINLLKVTHEIYAGSDIPRNFSSQVRVQSADKQDDHEVRIYMNNPLRYGGLTFYQYQMNAANGNSVFQVVRNPGWVMPYVACILMGGGLLIQFGQSLFRFARRRQSAAATS